MKTVYPAEGTPVWVDLCNPTREEIAQACTDYGLNIPPREELEEIEFSSRLQYEDGAFTLSVPVTPHNKGEKDVTSPLGFVLTADILVTVRFSSRIFHKDMEDAQRNIKKTNHMLRSTLVEIGDMGERLSHIRETLLVLQRAMPFVTEHGDSWMEAPVKARLKMAASDVQSLNDYEVHLTDKIQFLLDAALGFISTEQNDLFKVLTIASVVGIPPTFVASMYGMNFHFMPELAWHYGYAYGLGLIVLSTVIPIVWFKVRGWW